MDFNSWLNLRSYLRMQIAILSKDGQRKGRVSLFDRFTTRRSWSDSFRITQFDNAGKVVVDKLTDAL
ncbi:hypothetical protein KP3112_13865 [Klebsiella pneumoniae]|nr:hypothetical protein KP3112_13865 [Klebsiella pneumoniae]